MNPTHVYNVMHEHVTDISQSQNDVSFISSQYSTHQLVEHVPQLGIRGVATAAIQRGRVYLHAQSLVDVEILQEWRSKVDYFHVMADGAFAAWEVP